MKQISRSFHLWCLLFYICQSAAHAQNIDLDGINISGNTSLIHYSAENCLTASNTSAVTVTAGSQDVDFTGGTCVTLKPGFHASPSSGQGVFHAYIYTELVQCSTVPAQVGKYQKLEAELTLPSSVSNKITSFLNVVKKTFSYTGTGTLDPFNAMGDYSYPGPILKPGGTGNTPYNIAFDHGNGNYINPYDPDHISVEATFISPTNQSKLIYGFYYRDYTYLPSPSAAVYTDWAPGPSSCDWRVRFAPDEIGDWSCNVRIKIDNSYYIPYEINFPFECVGSNNPGYIKVAANNKNFKYSDPIGGNEYFFPIGDNYNPNPLIKDCFSSHQVGRFNCGFETNSSVLDCRKDNLLPLDPCIDPNDPSETVPCPVPPAAQYNCENFFDLRISADTKHEYERYAQVLSDNGGNTSRLFSEPEGFDIEREQLGIYDTRQIEMFELDNIINKYSEKGIYLVFMLMAPGDFWDISDLFRTWQDDAYTKDNSLNLLHYGKGWRWNPYRDRDNSANGICVTNANRLNFNDDTYDNDPPDPNIEYKGLGGIKEPACFFSSDVAKKMLKKRLRYIVARWGYSTNILSWEVMNEIEQNFIINVDDPQTHKKDHEINPYFDDMNPGGFPDPNYFQDITTKWVDEIATYLHSIDGNHMVSTNTLTQRDVIETSTPYTWKPENNFEYTDPGSGLTVPGIYQLSSLDFNNIHYYGSKEDNNWAKAKYAELWLTSCNKPVWITEHGGENYIEYQACSDYDIHNMLWSTALSNYAGAPLNFGEFNYQRDWHLETNYIALNSFVQNIDWSLNLQAHQTKEDHTSPSYTDAYENYYLKSSNKEKVFGWIHNRSFFTRNWQGECANQVDFVPFEYCNIPIPPLTYSMCDLIESGIGLPHQNCSIPITNSYDFYGTPEDYDAANNIQDEIEKKYINSNFKPCDYNSGNYLACTNYPSVATCLYPFDDRTIEPLSAQNIVIPDLELAELYDVKWYFTRGTGGLDNSQTQNGIQADAVNGDLIIQVPATGTGAYDGDWAYIITKQSMFSQRVSAPDSIPVSIHPNPSTGIFQVVLEKEKIKAAKEITISVNNMLGKTIAVIPNIKSETVQLDMSSQPKGIYNIIITFDGKKKIKKIVLS